jgi:hypothetical protein
MRIIEKDRGIVIEACPHGDTHESGWAIWEFDFSETGEEEKR